MPALIIKAILVAAALKLQEATRMHFLIMAFLYSVIQFAMGASMLLHIWGSLYSQPSFHSVALVAMAGGFLVLMVISSLFFWLSQKYNEDGSQFLIFWGAGVFLT